jgi:DNA-binding XRE family transcriptional regulator
VKGEALELRFLAVTDVNKHDYRDIEVHMPKKKKSDAMQFLDRLAGSPLTFGSLIETIRKTDDYTLASMSKKLGVSRANLCDIEKGRRKGVSLERAAKWARLLGYPESQFVALALQAEIDAAGLKYSVALNAA